MTLHQVQGLLEQTPLSPIVRDVVWAKALLESAHILADAVVLFSAGLIGTGLVGRAPAAERVRRFAPWLWSGLAVAAATGLMLLTGAGRRGLDNPVFQIKFSLLAAAVALTASVQWSLSRHPAAWDGGTARRAVMLVGPLVVLLWIATVFAGRFLAYSTAFFAPQY